MEIFIPLVIGLLLAKFASTIPLSVVIGINFFAIGLGFIGKWKRLILYCTLVLLGDIYGLWRFESAVKEEEKPIWSLTYDVKIEKIDLKPERSKIYGYGKIEKVYNKKYKYLEGHTLYFYLNGDQEYIPSQVLKMRSGIRVLKPAASETFFAYLVQKNIYLYGYRGEVLEVVTKENIFRHFFATVSQIFHDRIEYYIQKHGNNSTDGILYGILLSEKKELSKEQKTRFHNTSAAHLLAVSGLHIGIIGFALDLLLHCFFLKKSWRRVPIISILLLYVGAIGFPPSAVRAWLMLTCFWCAGFCLRKSLGLSSLLLAAILTLIYDPILLFDIGFQMSYGVVGMLLLLSAPLREIILYFLQKVGFYPSVGPRAKSSQVNKWFWKMTELLSVSIAATLASAPLTFEYFNTFSLVGIFLNPIIIQMALPVVICGFLFLLLGILHLELFLGDLLFLLARQCASWIDRLLLFSEKYIPWHIEFLTKPNGLGIGFFIICLLVSLKFYEMHKIFQWRRIHRMNL
ncbi:MAG: ComEC/Rec2 family competence protein [Puniceicoccales bacterium]|jgi:ComEC/Rec2-related protein|nr:ComEC/Rec2 family competence protein [Puniceicoccales bacterium]